MATTTGPTFGRPGATQLVSSNMLDNPTQLNQVNQVVDSFSTSVLNGINGFTSSILPSGGLGGFAGNISNQLSFNNSTSKKTNEMRVRLSPLPKAFDQVLGVSVSDNILTPLRATQGMIFPYTPQITLSQDVTYSDIQMVHTNGDVLAYQRTPSVSINIAGKFTIQNKNEGLYALAALHFMRTASKMYFGEKAGKNAGLPPPILVLNGYGDYVFNNLRVILKSHSYTYAETMDTVLVQAAGGSARLPVVFDLSLTLIVQQTPRTMRKEFDLEAFRTGKLMRSGGWI